MNNLPQIFMYQGTQIRMLVKDNEPWWVAKDVTDVLEIDASQVRRLDDDEKGLCSIQTLGGNQEMVCVNEPGLYALILGSKKPEAKPFKRWVTHEVLPEIRKTGTYGIQSKFTLPQTMPEALRLLAAEMEAKAIIAAEKEKLAIESAEQKQRLKEQETPVAIYNLAIAAKNTMSMQEVAKSLGTGRTRLYEVLREEAIVMKGSTLPYQRFIDAGYFKVTERPRASGDTIVNDPATRVTAKGFDYIARLMQKRNAS